MRRLAFLILLCASFPLHAATNKGARENLDHLLLGKDVKALLDMPAYKDGLDIYINTHAEKHLDERGLDLKQLSKYLKDKGVGVERDEIVTVTDVKVDNDRIEIHLGGGGEGRGASKNANKKGAGFKRAGGSRINFRYGRDLTDADLLPTAFFPFLSRVVDISRVNDRLAVQNLPPETRAAINAHTVTEGMTYQLVLLSAGEPDQKKVEDASKDDDDSLRETWYYLKDGHRWVIKFLNGRVSKVQIF